MKQIGITGGIGSGKTTVANFFKEFGIPVYIADEEAKKLMHRSPIKEELLELFGEKAYDSDNKLNRTYIASQVFNNKALLDKLNAIVHPRVAQDYKAWVEKQHSAYVLYEAAILFETGKHKQFDYNILVTAPKQERISRLLQRDDTTEEEIKARMENQWSDQQKEKFADWIVENVDLARTKEQITQLHAIISNL